MRQNKCSYATIFKLLILRWEFLWRLYCLSCGRKTVRIIRESMPFGGGDEIMKNIVIELSGFHVKTKR